ncbi:hypothetical protein KI387_031277, partial [Taxus chinensis]
SQVLIELEDVVVLSEDNSEELKEEEETPINTTEMENKGQMSESLGLVDPSSKDIPEDMPTSPLETSVVQTLS